ncbi:MAG: 16S rRNA (uracil(1498)-N(3))-methyltransferase [Candidatus Omnitrophota bacterium]
MSRFYVRPEDVRGDTIVVTGDEAHHIVDVMRMGEGDGVVAFDGTGREYVGIIKKISRGGLEITIANVIDATIRKGPLVTLVQALPKRAKIEYIIEKATELGVDEIIPLITERTIVKVSIEKRPDKLAHWQSIALSAAKQCGRSTIPRVLPVTVFKDLVMSPGNGDISMIACLDERTKPLKEIIAGIAAGRVMIMIGPEGDFTPFEIETALRAGAQAVSLGRLVLRSDTAGLYVLSAISYENSCR